ncbi:hypothetical protein ACFQVA_38235 [Actinomadura keratinilytica]
MSRSASTGRSGAARGSWWPEKDPSRELGRLCGELRQPTDRVERGGEPAARHWMPTVEETDGGDAYLVRAELPGIPRECVRVEMDGRELYISGTLDESSAQNALGRGSAPSPSVSGCPATPTTTRSAPTWWTAC